MAPETVKTSCCVVGGGPAGMMLGYLLARQGIQVKVLEKHRDFFRDFRGDTVHPSTLEILKELGLLEDFLSLPQQRVTSARVIIGDSSFEVADFSHVPTECKFIALMPQWDFLNFLSRHAAKLPTFELLTQHEATDLLFEDERVSGVVAQSDGGELRLHADLVIGCDGRHSITRRAAGLELIEYGVPIDVLWFRIARHSGDPEQVLGNVNYGKALILINRSDYFQAGLIIQKGSYEEIKAKGLDAFRDTIQKIAPFLRDRVNELQNWEQIKILTVQINRLRRWHRPGLLCIGDAAHAMSPAGGVGINLAIQDAVAAARILTAPLKESNLSNATLAAVQRRREFPTRITQAVQVFAHRGFARASENTGPVHAPWQAKAVLSIPGIHRVLGYAIGVGARPEHVEPSKNRNRARQIRKFAFSALMLTGVAVAAGWAVCKIRARKMDLHGQPVGA